MAESKWSGKLISKWQEGDVPSRIDGLQSLYKRWILVFIALAGGGSGMMCATANPRVVALGLLLAISGAVSVALTKTWASIKLSMLHVIWELHERKHAHSD
jgi:hypothetical protein